jgi:multidrug efflux pump subunit AcrB
LFAALEGTLAVIIMSALLTFQKSRKRKYKTPLICSFVVPVTGVVSLAIITLTGNSIDKIILSGLACGMGAAIDSAILSAEKLGNVSSIECGKTALKRLIPPLVSGALTTIIVLLPLMFLSFASKTIIAIALSIGVVTFVSLIIAIVILPTLFLYDCESVIKKEAAVVHKNNIKVFLLLSSFKKKAGRMFMRFIARTLFFCVKRPVVICALAFLISIAGLMSVVISGADIGGETSEDSVYAQVEFDGGLRSEEADKKVSEWAKLIKEYNGIKNVQTGSRVGGSSVLVSFNPAIIDNAKVREVLRSKNISEGFVFINEASNKESIWQIKVSGDSALKCREVAEEAANICVAIPVVKQTVFNFKDGSPRLILTPDRAKIASENTGFSFVQAAGAVRSAVYGPVVYKRVSNNDGEVDVRIKSIGNIAATKEDIENILIANQQQNTANTKLNSVMISGSEKESSGIRRENRIRTASISVITNTADPRKMRDKIMPQIKKIDLPAGYSIEFDKAAVEAAEALSDTVFYFLLAIIFCYIVIAMSNESVFIPIAVLAMVPPAMAVPALFMFVFGYSFNAASACAFIAVSGMAVNAGVLITDEIKDVLKFSVDNKQKFGLLYKAVRKRIPALVATSVTTISASIPFLFLSEGSNFIVKSLSFVTVFGVGASAVFSMFLIPSIAALNLKIFKTKEVI